MNISDKKRIVWKKN